MQCRDNGDKTTATAAAAAATTTTTTTTTTYSSIITYTITPLQHRTYLQHLQYKHLNITELVRMLGNSQDCSYNHIRGCLFVN